MGQRQASTGWQITPEYSELGSSALLVSFLPLYNLHIFSPFCSFQDGIGATHPTRIARNTFQIAGGVGCRMKKAPYTVVPWTESMRNTYNN